VVNELFEAAASAEPPSRLRDRPDRGSCCHGTPARKRRAFLTVRGRTCDGPRFSDRVVLLNDPSTVPYGPKEMTDKQNPSQIHIAFDTNLAFVKESEDRLISRKLGQLIVERSKIRRPQVSWYLLEPVSKSSEEHNEAGELDKAEEVLGVILPADEDAALPLDPSEEALDQPASHVAA
jgi:hypothetical protein